MNFDPTERFAAQPARLSALLLNRADAHIDARLQEAIEEEGLFGGLSGLVRTQSRPLMGLRRRE